MSALEPREDPGTARITGRAPVLRPSVPLHRHMVYGKRLSHALDLTVLIHIHYMCEDGKNFSVADLVEALRDQGIRSANGRGDGLVGSKAVYQSVARLQDVGFLERHQANEGGSFGEVTYTFHEFPEWSLQGDSLSPILPLLLTGEAEKNLPTGNGISAGRTASPHKACANKARADRRTGASDVSAVQTASPYRRSASVSPPTPPLQEEEDYSSSLNPSTAAGGVAGLDEAAVTAAREFLALLPGRWACGRKTATRLAPLLAEAVAAQGWALGAALVAQLTRRARGKSVEVGVLLAERIEDLPLYRATRAAVPGEQRDQARTPAAAQLPFDGQASGPVEPGGASAAAPEQPAPVVVPAEQLAQARELLLSLTAPWHVGPGDAERLAPLLAVVVSERGWSFDEELRQQLMSNPGGGSNYLYLLEHKRIKALPVRRRAGAGPARGGRSTHRSQAAIDACSRCDAYGYFESGDRHVVCHHDLQPDPAGIPSTGTASGADLGAGSPQDPAPDAGSGVGQPGPVGDVAALALAMVSGMSPQAALGIAAPQLSAEERERLAAQSEEERRHAAHNHALHATR